MKIITVQAFFCISLKKFCRLSEAGDICVYDLQSEYPIDPREFKSKGKSTPFDGMTVTVRNGDRKD